MKKNKKRGTFKKKVSLNFGKFVVEEIKNKLGEKRWILPKDK